MRVFAAIYTTRMRGFANATVVACTVEESLSVAPYVEPRTLSHVDNTWQQGASVLPRGRANLAQLIKCHQHAGVGDDTVFSMSTIATRSGRQMTVFSYLFVYNMLRVPGFVPAFLSTVRKTCSIKRTSLRSPRERDLVKNILASGCCCCRETVGSTRAPERSHLR